MNHQSLKILIIATFVLLPFIVFSQTFYDGTTVHVLTELGAHKIKKCKIDGPVCHHCAIRFKSTLRKKGKWTDLGSRILVKNHEFNKYQFGQISVLVGYNQLTNFLQLEELCNSAILSIPYEQLNFESNNSTYSELRDKLVAQLQYIRIKEILIEIIGTELWLEVPDGHSDEDLCK